MSLVKPTDADLVRRCGCGHEFRVHMNGIGYCTSCRCGRYERLHGRALTW